MEITCDTELKFNDEDLKLFTINSTVKIISKYHHRKGHFPIETLIDVGYIIGFGRNAANELMFEVKMSNGDQGMFHTSNLQKVSK